jgi:hypothetical protein
MTHPIRIVAHLVRSAERLMSASQYRDARHRLLHAVELAPSAGLHERIGICCLRLGQKRLARRHLRAAVRMRPGRARTHALLGMACDDPAKKALHLRRAVKLSPEPRWLSRAGLAAVRAGEIDGGLEMLREAARHCGEFAITRRLVLGLCEAGLPGEAEWAVMSARFASPRCPRLRGLLGRVRAGRACSYNSPVGDDGPLLLPFAPVEGVAARREPASALAVPRLVRLRRRPMLGRSS